MSDDDEPDGFSEGVSRSKGDPRVFLALNAVLSMAFASVVAWGLSLLGAAEFTLVNVASMAVVLFAVTYLLTS